MKYLLQFSINEVLFESLTKKYVLHKSKKYDRFAESTVHV